jgi:hypothetical protein
MVVYPVVPKEMINKQESGNRNTLEVKQIK